MMTDDYMTIREMCDAFDVTPRTLRFYEAKELLFPVRQGTKRLFTKRDRARLKLILRGKRLGFSLAETGRLFDLYDADRTSRKQLHTMLELIQEKKQDLQQQMDDIKIVMMELSSAETQCQQALHTLIND